MAAGKTSVGRALAERTSRRFVDLDDGLDTSLVAHDEPEFRRREAAALDAAIAAGDGIVATGGGVGGVGGKPPPPGAPGPGGPAPPAPPPPQTAAPGWA